MAYLSRIWLNPLRASTQRMIRNPQAMHAIVLGGLNRQPVTERVLWRLETGTRFRAELLVLTASVPSWEHVVEQSGWPQSDDPQAVVRPYQPLLDRVELGREFAFRLRANPVSSTRHPQKPSAAQQQHLEASPRPRGVHVPHRTAAHQLDWFVQRAQSWGFDVVSGTHGAPQVQLVHRERLVFSKNGRDSERHRVVLQTATFEGRIRVLDPERARHHLLDGVGRARAYGCGLLTLAPAAGGTGTPLTTATNSTEETADVVAG